MKIKIIILILITIILSGCIEKQDGQRNISENNITQNTDSFEDKKNVVDIAKQDAIKRFNLSEDNIKIVSIIPVEWTDTSLGYPEPGKEIGRDYSLETIQGYVIIIYDNGKLYEYHSDYYRIASPISYVEEIPIMINSS